jgi:hypothetical protein
MNLKKDNLEQEDWTDEVLGACTFAGVTVDSST